MLPERRFRDWLGLLFVIITPADFAANIETLAGASWIFSFLREAETIERLAVVVLFR